MEVGQVVDRQVSAGCVFAYGMWAVSIGLWGLAWAIGSDEVGRLSIIVCGVAATATIRTYFIDQGRRLKTMAGLLPDAPRSVRTVPQER